MSTKIKLNKVPSISTLQEMVLINSKKYSKILALEDLKNTPIQKITYEELLLNVLRFGSALKALGLQEREHIAVISENRVQWAITYLACACFNYVIVPIDKNLITNEILNILHESDAKAIVFSEQYADLMMEKYSSLHKLEYLISMDSTDHDSDISSMTKMINEATEINSHSLSKIDPDALFEIIFTSGSLGRAKGVMLSQKNIVANLMSMLQMLMMYPDDRFLSVLPMHHTYECTCGLLCPLFAGSSVHYAQSLKTIVDDLQKVKATILLGVPLLYDKMFKRITKAIKEDKVKSKVVPQLVRISNFVLRLGVKSIKKKVFKELHNKFGGSIRVFIAGGAAPDPEVAKGLRGFGFNFIQGYGLTETSPILALNNMEHFKDEAAGLPLPGVELRINEPDEYGSGEIFVKAPNVMLGYYKNEKATLEAFKDGWFKTGDIGFFDKDGFLHINGRKKNVIISKSGKNVFPEEVEDILNRSPFVLESLIVGEQNNKQNEIVTAKIVPDAGMFIDYSETNNVQLNSELMQQIFDNEIKNVNKQLPSYKRIVKYDIREQEFEKTTTQKIKRYLTNN